ncbi:MAG TPA: hypothetical protein VFX84_00300 [Candidatus Saccharimonadales bacterium]|nr:hypothetical protein [Candidatus Saccharimonadales bacterium]
MIALSEIPLNSIVWSMGSMACFMLCYRSFISYRSSRNELSKYLTWFGLLMGIGLALLAVPAFFTSDTAALRTAYLAGEFFIYGSAVAQAAILWCLLLRSRFSIYFATVPVLLLGLCSWAYAIPHSTLRFTTDNFIEYRDPLFSTIVIGTVLIGLFVPVGLYFLRSASRQEGTKAILTSLTLGLVYIGVGFFTGGIELLTGQVITPRSAVFDLAFFFVMFSVLLWPHRAPAKVPAVR